MLIPVSNSIQLILLVLFKNFIIQKINLLHFQMKMKNRKKSNQWLINTELSVDIISYCQTIPITVISYATQMKAMCVTRYSSCYRVCRKVGVDELIGDWSCSRIYWRQKKKNISKRYFKISKMLLTPKTLLDSNQTSNNNYWIY